jgi:hypothetical protein
MTKDAITDYDATPGSNAELEGTSVAEGCPPANLNNAVRILMSHLALNTGTGNIVLSASPTLTGTVGAAAITATGVVTGATIEATGDTSAGDTSAIGYTAAEGLILTGQGSTNDVTIKNDADAQVLSVPTGTTNVKIENSLFIRGQADADADDAAFGQLWVNTATPNELYFRNDTGTDFLLSTTSPTLVAPIITTGTISKLIIPSTSELTIATGAITATASRHTVDTEDNAASDDLDTINGGTDGQILILQAADTSHTVIAKDGTGNLALASEHSINNTEDVLVLMYNSTLSKWVELLYSNNGAA